MKRTDEELLRDITSGDSEALGILYDRHSRLVYGAILRLLKDTDEAEDVLQDVFVQVWRKAFTYQPALGSPKNWLVRIAHNRAVNVIRSVRVRQKQSELTEDEVAANQELIDDTLLDKAISSERIGIIQEAFRDLPPDQVELLDLAFIQGYSHTEIAELLKIPLGTVKSKIRNGLLGMRRSLDFLHAEFT